VLVHACAGGSSARGSPELRSCTCDPGSLSWSFRLCGGAFQNLFTRFVNCTSRSWSSWAISFGQVMWQWTWERYTCVLARLVGRAGHVYAFEPALQAATTLRRNLQRNGLSWVEFHRAACCESAGLGILHHEADWGRNWLAKEELAEQKCRDVEEVDTVALDNIVARADFIKIDVEGSELRVLEGARRLLGGCRPVIQFEINAEAAQRTGVDPLGALKFLRSQGYRFLRLRGAPSQFSFEWTEGDYDGNVFAVPVDRGSAFMPNGKER
jgi:FkbM family methyltransferase